MNKLQNTENLNKELNPALTQGFKDWNEHSKEMLEQKFLKDIEDWLEKRKSIYNIAFMLNNVDFHGYSTRLCYETYYDFCIDNNASILSDVDFSRTICKWFGYEVVDKKRKGKKYRVFKKIQDESKGSR